MVQQSGTVVSHINPDLLARNPAFTQAVIVNGPARTIYIGGQDSVDESGAIIGKDDLKLQVEQIFKNLQIILAEAGASLEHVVKWNVLVVQGQPIQSGFEVFQRVWGNRPNPPIITFAFVSGLGRPEFLVEMDAIAVVPL